MNYHIEKHLEKFSTPKPRSKGFLAVIKANFYGYYVLLFGFACFSRYGHAGLWYMTGEAEPIMADV